MTRSSWHDLGHRLPLLVIGLLSATTGIVAVFAYDQLRHATISMTERRVQSASVRLASVFAESNARLRREGSPLSHEAVWREALEAPPGDSLSPARLRASARLDEERRRLPQLLRAELWSGRGRLVASAGGERATIPRLDATRSWDSPFGPLLAVHDSVLTELRLPVLGTHGDTLGILRQLSLLDSRQSSSLIQGLIGSNARVRVGNLAGGLWTDLATRVSPPPRGKASGGAARAAMLDGERVIGSHATVWGMPWLVWIGVPESAVLDDVRGVLLRILLVSLAVVLAGAVVARVLVRVVLAPLGGVVEAAEGVAGGDYGRRAPVVHPDEIGRLATTFNEMAARIESNTVDLESQRIELEVQQAELEETNEDLRRSAAAAAAALAAVEAADHRAAAVVAASMDCVVTMDHRGVIVEFNRAAEAAFGHAADQAIGRKVSELLIPAAVRARHEEGLARYLETGQSRIIGERVEVVALRADGSEFPVELATIRLPLPGEPLFTCFIRDLSRHRLLEEQLRHAQKMEAVGQLAGGIAHDFNNILTVIISYGDLALADGGLPRHARNDITQMRAAADRAAALTRQLLAFSRKQVLRPTELDINDVVIGMSTMLARLIPSSVRLQTRLGGAIDRVSLDRGQLEQVIVNLVVNARDAMPDGGTLTIETSNATLDDAYIALHAGASRGPHVLLSVEDTGVGMDAATRERIFEPFFTTKPAGQGTGLGLATSYGIVQQSGGSIYAYSEPGRGTAFKLYFPSSTAASPEPAPAALPAIEPVAPALILLVEDDPTVRMATRRILESMGHTVMEAPDAATALDLAFTSGAPFQLVLTDVVMAGGSGLDLAAELAVGIPTLPVILMSGYSEAAVRRDRDLAGKFIFLDKPFTADQLERALARVLPLARGTPG